MHSFGKFRNEIPKKLVKKLRNSYDNVTALKKPQHRSQQSILDKDI